MKKHSKQKRPAGLAEPPCSAGFERIPSYVSGMMYRYELKLYEACCRGQRYGPFYIHGRKFRRRKFRQGTREWAYWAAKHNRLASGIRRVTGYNWAMPERCNSVRPNKARPESEKKPWQ